ncbi:hypothetical protein [Pseudomonas sp. MF4836]|uniref:hypothetical protein n=1 Tax=Pseudomonas sp. MF4836 TaxID=1960827 RepID=UPI000C7BE9C4|nr:hypothetical protein [Pseudomonas sp. MF4836]
MPRFEVWHHAQLIGWSELESGDPPMGVAFGLFIPAPAYAQVQALIRARAESDQSDLHLSVLHQGQALVCAGVYIQDFSADCGEDAIEVTVLGISEPPYAELFAQHAAAYWRPQG